ncbi:MAG: PPOX class F420-dependent oxidoreductase [Dehalococcoidia bacterium]|nr:PPOX class F420-dependent oxidoreductase [Dehalococcoidia bacterium]
MTAIPDSHRDLLTGTNFAHVATIQPGGEPQVSPVWIDLDGDEVVFNTALDRRKARNLDRDPRVALSVHDQQNPYRYIQVRGRVVGKTTDGADDHIDALAKRYLGVDRYPGHEEGVTRVIYRIQPERVQTMG